MDDWNGRCGCEMPERPLSYGAYICSRHGCFISVVATGKKYPDLKLCIKFGGPRQVITWEQYAEIYSSFDCPEERVRALCGHYSVNGEDDYVREIFVVDGTGAPA